MSVLLASVAAAGAARAADVDITTDSTSGVVLDGYAGTIAEVAAGVTLQNSTFTFACPVPTGGTTSTGLCASTHAWTVTNKGTIGPVPIGDGVHFSAGGTLINEGTVGGGFNSIAIEGAPGTVQNMLGGVITDGITIGTFLSAAAGTVTNAGSITSNGFGQVIGITGDGQVSNLATGRIIGHGGVNAVSITSGTDIAVGNWGLIQSNESGYATGVSIDPGTVTNYAGGRVLGALTGVWAHSGGPTTVNNAGLIEASQAATYFGVTGSAIELDGGGTVVNSGILRSISTDGSDATIWSSGATTVTNTGTVESTNGGLAMQFVGNDDHAVILGTGSKIVGNVAGSTGTGTDSLALQGTGTESLAKFLNFETLTMNGGTWTVTGAGTFSTGAEIKGGGELHVDGTLTTPTLTVDSGGTLSGTGMIAGVLVVNGAVGPGNSIGVLEATTAAFNAGSLISVEVDPTDADKLIVDGTATIDPGATVLVSAAAGTYAYGQRYLILDAGTRVGTFGGVSDTSAFLDFALDQSDPNQVWLQISRIGRFSDAALTPNQLAASTGLQELDPASPLFQAILPLDAVSARRAFDLSSGEIHPTVRGVLLEDSRFLREAVLSRLSQRFAEDFAPPMPPLSYVGDAMAVDPANNLSTPTAGFTGWGQALGSWADAAGDGNAASLSRSLGGFVTGADAAWGIWDAGVALGYRTESVSAPDRMSSAGVQGVGLAAYGAAAWGRFALRAGGALAAYGVDTVRHDRFAGFDETLTAHYGAQSEQAFAEVAYRMRFAAIDLEPFAGLADAAVQTDGFTESGGLAALSAAGRSDNLAFFTLGGRFGYTLPVADGMLKFTGLLAWQHAFGGVVPTTPLAFAGGTPFTIAGTPIARDVLRLDAGLDWAVNRQTTLGVAYTGAFGSGLSDQGGKATFKVRF